MTYKLNPELKLIRSPIVLMINDRENEYPNGEALAEQEFEKNYRIVSVTAKDSRVVITLRENEMVNNINWIGEEAVSFF